MTSSLSSSRIFCHRFKIILALLILIYNIYCHNFLLNNNTTKYYHATTNKSYIDYSWMEYISEIYNDPTLKPTDIDKYTILMYYKNSKIKIKPLNWKSKLLYSTLHGRWNNLPGRYRSGIVSPYTVPSYNWIEVHRFSVHLLYGKDKLEGYSDVSHTTGSLIQHITIYIIFPIHSLDLCTF
jgi:hypothetical protein